MAEEGGNEPLVELVGSCAWPSEAYWRSFELAVLEGQDFLRPLLEIGCGDGAFTALLGICVDDGVDLNLRAVERARERSETYDAVHCMDIMEFRDKTKGLYATIFANSVFEHISDVEPVVRACLRLLKPSGRLIFTVPLVAMNQNLLIGSQWYAEFRRRQLQHRNLWSADEWRAALHAVGFVEIETLPYLPGGHCRFWDRIDFLGDAGLGRYRLAPAVRKIGSIALPRRVKASIKHSVARRLQRRRKAASCSGEDWCAALFIATKCDRSAAD
jgi:SAM-dependent methyltransferase